MAFSLRNIDECDIFIAINNIPTPINKLKKQSKRADTKHCSKIASFQKISKETLVEKINNVMLKGRIKNKLNRTKDSFHLKRKIFYQGFLPHALAIHMIAGDRGGTIFILFYHFRPLTNIQKLICNFACKLTTRYF